MKAEKENWQPPEFVSREQCIKDTEEVLGMPDIPIRQTEDIFRINVLGMDWDLGMVVYEPEDPKKIPVGADGKKAGFFLLHGGSGDFKGIEEPMPSCWPASSASKWSPGPFRADSTFDVRAAIGRAIPSTRTARSGRRSGSKASDHAGPVRGGERHLDAQPLRHAHGRARQAGYELLLSHGGLAAAFEEGMIEAMRRHFPEARIFRLCVRATPPAGRLSACCASGCRTWRASSPPRTRRLAHWKQQRRIWGGAMGKIEGYEQVATKPARAPIRSTSSISAPGATLRATKGPEALGQEGPTALMRLPAIMEDILEHAGKAKARPQFKAEYIITHAITGSLAEGARVTAARLKMNQDETEALVCNASWDTRRSYPVRT